MGFEIDRCPHCRTLLDVRHGAAQDTTIGSPIATCPQCRKAFRTGKSEWIDKSNAEQFAYFLRLGWWVVCGSLLLGIGAYTIIGLVVCNAFGLPVEKTLTKYLLASLVASLVLSMAFAWWSAKTEIRKSLSRKATHRVGQQ